MKVIVSCEFSQIVTKAFRDRGHDAFSCDLMPTEGNPDWHIQDDVLKHLNDGWDMMIGHPECTYLCNSGVRWLYSEVGRWEKMYDASDFFYKLWNCKIPKICLENPIPTKHALLPEYTQIIQPWQFGHGETKATCLWLKGLPKLQPTKIVDGRIGRVHHEPPSVERWKNRSRTLPGIAKAMAKQWGSIQGEATLPKLCTPDILQSSNGLTQVQGLQNHARPLFKGR